MVRPAQYAQNIARQIGHCAVLPSLFLLTACGGGGSGGGVASTPAPPAAPTPPPPPAPTPPPPPPPTNFDTAEFRRSDGPEFHGAITAWQNGATGAGVTIGVIDSGIDLDGNEFTGRIHPLSADLDGNRGLDDIGGHGTAVSHVAAAARNNSGILGIAFDAQLLVLRADIPGSCESDDGCSYSNTAIAAGLDRAVQAGARVVNISLGGSPPTLALRQAVDRATRAGVIVIASAGNDGDADDATIDRDNPDPLASGLRASGNGLVIIAGSVDAQSQISAFSNRAGNEAQSYLTALGDGICCEYRDGSLFVTPDNNAFFFRGTSFSAPQIAGAVALMAEAFPNLTSSQIVQLLLTSARDAGDPGTDVIYGRGILDIAAAFAPQGATSLAGSTTMMPLDQSTGIMSSAMGDAGQGGAGVNAVILDGYERAYTINLADALDRTPAQRMLTRQLAQVSRSTSLQMGQTKIAMTVRPDHDKGSLLHPIRQSYLDMQQGKMSSFNVTTQLARNTQIAFAVRADADGLTRQLDGRTGPSFLVAEQTSTGMGFDAVSSNAMALRHVLGAVSLIGFVQSGSVNLPTRTADAEQEYLPRFTQFGVKGDLGWRSLSLGLGMSMLEEDETLLGARFNPVLAGQGGASSMLVDATIDYQLRSGWALSAQWRQGFTRPRAGGVIASRDVITSTAFAVDVQRAGLFDRQDSFALRFAQPLRVSGGGLLLNLPDQYDYATRSAGYSDQRLSLAPNGRELIAEIVYGLPVLTGYLSTNIFYRHEPQNIASAPDDMGIAIRFSRGF